MNNELPNDYCIINPHYSVGSYEIVKGGHIYFTFTAKPSWWHRFWTRVLLGWIWVDA